MKSLDTNILIYAANRSCTEHERAKAVVELIYQEPAEWIIADQVMFEYVRALSNRMVLTKPLSKENAISVVRDFRESCGARFCCYEGVLFNKILALHAKGTRDRLYDVVLAETLRHAGVTRFYTRNLKDFRGLGFEEVIDPIDE